MARSKASINPVKSGLYKLKLFGGIRLGLAGLSVDVIIEAQLVAFIEIVCNERTEISWEFGCVYIEFNRAARCKDATAEAFRLINFTQDLHFSECPLAPGLGCDYLRRARVDLFGWELEKTNRLFQKRQEQHQASGQDGQ